MKTVWITHAARQDIVHGKLRTLLPYFILFKPYHKLQSFGVRFCNKGRHTSVSYMQVQKRQQNHFNIHYCTKVNRNQTYCSKALSPANRSLDLPRRQREREWLSSNPSPTSGWRDKTCGPCLASAILQWSLLSSYQPHLKIMMAFAQAAPCSGIATMHRFKHLSERYL